MSTILSLCLCCFAAADPGGWQAARWGMTEGQILVAVPNAIVASETSSGRYTKYGFAPISIPDVEVAGVALRLYLTVDPKQGLIRVLLSPCEPKATTAQTFQDIEAQLVQKYSHPWSRSTEGTQVSQWAFPTTIITLRCQHVRSPVVRGLEAFLLSLVYEQKKSDAPI